MTVLAGVRADWDLQAELNGEDGGWTSIKRDYLEEYGLRAKYGSQAGGPLDLVADAGMMTFSLNNSERNSGRSLGWYSFDNPFPRMGWDLGIRIRFMLGGVPRFYGWLRRATPTPGALDTRDVPCIVTDWMDHAARWKIKGLATMTNVTATEIFNAILAAMAAAMAKEPIAVEADETRDVYTVAGDTARTGESTGLSEFQKISQSGFERIYVRGDGTLRLEARDARTSAAPDVVFSKRWPYQYSLLPRYYDVEDVITRVQVTTYPRRVDDTVKVLYTHREKTTLKPGESRTFTCRYVDPEQLAARVGGKDMVAPVSGTDYTATAKEDGTGASMTASMTVELPNGFGADSADVKVTNTHATQRFTIQTLQLRGYGIYAYDAVTIEDVADEATMRKYGDNPLPIQMLYQSSSTVGKAVGQAIRGTFGQRMPAGGVLRFCASRSRELMALAERIEISTCLTAEDDVNGTASWFVNGLQYELEAGDILWVTAFLTFADLTSYFRASVSQLGDPSSPIKGF